MRVVVAQASLPGLPALVAWPLVATTITMAETVVPLLSLELPGLTVALAVLLVVLRAAVGVVAQASPIPSQPIPVVPVRPATMVVVPRLVPILAVVAAGPMQARAVVPVALVACVSLSGPLSSDPL